MRVAVVVACGLIAASCASPATQGPAVTAEARRSEEQKQAQFVIERRAAEIRHIYDIAYAIEAANLESCARTAPQLAAAFETSESYAKEFRSAARVVLGGAVRPRPVWIGKNGPAEKAGLLPTDTLVAVNGIAIPEGAKAMPTASAQIRKGLDASDLKLTVERPGGTVDLVVPIVRACDYEVEVADSSVVNAYADGRRIIITRGIAKFAENDSELALVISHELAHNAMGHLQKQGQNRLVGALAGALLDVAAAYGGADTQGYFTKTGAGIGGAVYSQEFEAEADYVGMYYMAKAGYSMDGVEGFWRRMAAENPSQIRIGASHPSTASRFVSIAATRDEIESKRRSGQPLEPTLKQKADS